MKTVEECSKCAFAIPKLKEVPLTYGCMSPHEKGSKCKFGVGLKE